MSLQKRERALYSLIWMARVAVALLMITVALVLDGAAAERHRADVRQEWQARLNDLSLKLQRTILQNVQTVWGLAANVSVQPDINEDEFQELASVIFGLAPQLRNIGLAPDFVIRHIHPLDGNRAALGLDLTRQSLSTEQIRQLLISQRAIFSGPINLVQGGTGMAARIPIFENDGGRFWGVISVILDLDRLFEAANFSSVSTGGPLAISTSADTRFASDIFFGDSTAQWHQPVTARLDMPGMRWTLFAQPGDGWPNHPESPAIIRSLLGFMVLMITAGVFWLTNLLLRDHQMQRHFSGLFELAPFGIGLYKLSSGKLLRSNNSFENIFGDRANSLDFFARACSHNGRELPTGLDISENLHTDSRFSGLEAYLPGLGEELHPIRLHGLTLETHQSESVIWLIAEDVSEQKKADRMKNEFISTVSHELRTPLTSIAGSLGLLSNNAAGELPQNASRLADIAYRNTRQLTFLINDLLDIEALVTGKMAFKIAPCPVAEIIQECVEGISSFSVEKHVSLRTGRLHQVLVEADRGRLCQALNNLLSNAIKFSFDRSVVDVFTETTQGAILIFVQDQGPGIPPEFRARIFEKFSQADSSDRRSIGGTGLGLAITRELMIAMGGEVGYTSERGQGARFWLRLPLASPDAS